MIKIIIQYIYLSIYTLSKLDQLYLRFGILGTV